MSCMRKACKAWKSPLVHDTQDKLDAHEVAKASKPRKKRRNDAKTRAGRVKKHQTTEKREELMQKPERGESKSIKPQKKEKN